MGRCKFNSAWLKKEDNTKRLDGDWCAGSVNSDEEAFCKVCNKSFMCIRGWNSIIQHSEGEKHVSNLRAKLDPLQLVLQTTSSSNPEINLTGPKAELIWAMNNVIRDMSAASCNGIANIFKAMFPGEVSAELSLGETKVSYLITEALSPHFR